MISGSNVRRRLLNDIGHAILKNCSWWSSHDLKKTRDYATAKKGVCLSHIKYKIQKD